MSRLAAAESEAKRAEAVAVEAEAARAAVSTMAAEMLKQKQVLACVNLCLQAGYRRESVCAAVESRNTFAASRQERARALLVRAHVFVRLGEWEEGRAYSF